MSLKRENRMRAALGLDALPEPIPTPPCPDCGEVHNGGRCHGRPVVVVLKTAPKPRRYSRIADMPASMLARAIKQRREYGA